MPVRSLRQVRGALVGECAMSICLISRVRELTHEVRAVPCTLQPRGQVALVQLLFRKLVVPACTHGHMCVGKRALVAWQCWGSVRCAHRRERTSPLLDANCRHKATCKSLNHDVLPRPLPPPLPACYRTTGPSAAIAIGPVSAQQSNLPSAP